MRQFREYDIYNPDDRKVTELIPEILISSNIHTNLAHSTFTNMVSDLKIPLPNRTDLTQENLIKEGVKWLSKVDMTLYDTDEGTLDELYQLIIENVDTEKHIMEGLPVVALDLETTGLSRKWVSYGGAIRIPTAIIGMGISFENKNGDEFGVYIPIAHVKTKNHNINDLIKFSQKIMDNFYTVYHNGLYDREIYQMHSIRLAKYWHDTMLMAIACQLRASSKDSVGLKHLSGDILGRKMLEIDDVADNAELYRQAAQYVLTYGSADVINTLKLFWFFQESDEFTNPFEEQKAIMNIDTVAADYTNSLNRFNLPIHYSNTRGIFFTTFRRVILCEHKIRQLTNNEVDNIASAEQMGIWIYQQLLQDLKKEYIDSTTSEGTKNDIIADFNKRLKDEFSMEVKNVTLKSGETKIKVNSGKEAIEKLLYGLDKLKWISDEVRQRVIDVADCLQTFRTVEQSLGVVSKFFRYVYTDDCPIPRAGVGIKFFGAITTRYSNESGSGYDRVIFKTSKKGTTGAFKKGNGICGNNVQGIPADPPHYAKVRKLTKIPKAVQDKLDVITKEVGLEVPAYLEGL